MKKNLCKVCDQEVDLTTQETVHVGDIWYHTKCYEIPPTMMHGVPFEYDPAPLKPGETHVKAREGK